MLIEQVQIVRIAQKNFLSRDIILSNELAPQLQRCQFRFGLDALMVAEIDVM